MKKVDRKEEEVLIKNLLLLTKVTIDFSEVLRVPVYRNTKRESDVEHSYMLALQAAYLAHAMNYELDAGLIVQFALVHDLLELVTGDIPTLGLDDEGHNKKAAAEKQALKIVPKQLPDFWADLLLRYEEQVEPEACFVRAVDKLTPRLVNIAGDGKAGLKHYGFQSIQELDNVEKIAHQKFVTMFPDFPEIGQLHDELTSLRRKALFPYQ